MDVKLASGHENGDVGDGGNFQTVDNPSSYLSADSTTKFSGSYSLRFNSGGGAADYGVVYQFFEATTYAGDIYAQGKIRIDTATSDLTAFLILEDEVAGQWVGLMRVDTGRHLELWVGGVTPTQLGLDSAALTLGQWYEWRLFYDYSAQTLTAYLDGVQFATGASAASADNAYVLYYGSDALVTGDFYLDDLIITSDTFVKYTALIHARGTDDGDSTDWSRSDAGGPPFYTAVDEVTPNNATDYLIADTDLEVFEVDFQSLVSLGLDGTETVRFMLIEGRHRAQATGTPAFDIKWRFKSQPSGTVAEGPSVTHNDVTWKTNGDVNPRNKFLTVTTDPQTGNPLNASHLAFGQMGAKAYDATPQPWVTTVWALIVYSDPTTVAVDGLAANGTAAVLDVAPGGVAIGMDALPGNGIAAALGVAPGPVAVAIDALTAPAVAAILDVLPGAAAVIVDPLGIASIAAQLDVIPGGVALALDALVGDAAADPLAVVPGGIAVVLDVLPGSALAATVAILPGPVAIALDALPMAAAAAVLSVAPGAVAVLIDPLALTGTAAHLEVVPGGVVLPLDVLAGLGVAATLSVVLGPASIIVALDALGLIAIAPDIGAFVATTPDGRTVVIAAENRVIVVGREIDIEPLLARRVVVVPTEARTVLAPRRADVEPLADPRLVEVVPS